eukprot:268944_1
MTSSMSTPCFKIMTLHLLCIRAVCSQYIPWYTGSAEFNLPADNDRQAIGYDEIQNNIYLVGGYSYQGGLVQYELNSSNENAIYAILDYGSNYLSGGLFFNAQSYVQHNNILYMVPSWDANVHQMDLATQIVTYTITSLPKPISESCMTAMTIDHDYLVIIGGLDFSSSPYILKNTTQVFDITDNVWIATDKPYLNAARSTLTCAVLDKRIYAIGGYDGSYPFNSIEILDVTEGMGNITAYEWQYMQESMPIALSDHRSVIYGHQILNIGGNSYNEKIVVIDTITETSFIGGSTSYAATSQPVIIVYPYIYAFGGYNGNLGNNLAIYQYHKINTNPPTSQPTSLPTTNNPTTNSPTTSIPTTNNPTTISPTTSSPTTQTPTTSNPTTVTPTATPITSFPTTSIPTTNSPITPMPTTSNPTTSMPTTFAPVTTSPTS